MTSNNYVDFGNYPSSLLLNALRLERTLAVLDVEATGLDVTNDRVVEVAAVRVGPEGGQATLHRRVNPGIPIPDAATCIHGIADSDVSGCPRFADVAADLLGFLDGADLAGFGIAKFDLPILAAEFRRAGMTFPLAGRAIVDALVVFHRREPRNLASAVRLYLEREHTGAHSALADAKAALEVLDAQVGRYGLPPTAAGLHADLCEVDVGGRFRRDEDSEIVFAFGKYRGQRLAEVARTDPSYLAWALSAVTLLDDARALIRDAVMRSANVRHD